jgi:hypothetical protein
VFRPPEHDLCPLSLRQIREQVSHHRPSPTASNLSHTFVPWIGKPGAAAVEAADHDEGCHAIRGLGTDQPPEGLGLNDWPRSPFGGDPLGMEAQQDVLDGRAGRSVLDPGSHGNRSVIIGDGVS